MTAVSPVQPPRLLVQRGAGGGAIADAAAQAAAVIAFPEAKARSSAYRINLARESVTAQALLPLDASGGAPRKVTELGPLSCAPPTACGFAEVAKLPLMSPA